MPTPSSDCSGKNSRVCSVVKATSVPMLIAGAPLAMLSPANSRRARA